MGLPAAGVAGLAPEGIACANASCGRETGGVSAKRLASNQSRRYPLNLCHVVVKDGLLAAIIPFDGHASPILFNDGALIISISIPANAVADIEDLDWPPVINACHVVGEPEV